MPVPHGLPVTQQAVLRVYPDCAPGVMSGVEPGSPPEQRVGRSVGARADGVALHQRTAAVGHGQPQRSQRTVLRHPGCQLPRRSPALPACSQQGARAAQTVRFKSPAMSFAVISRWCDGVQTSSPCIISLRLWRQRLEGPRVTQILTVVPLKVQHHSGCSHFVAVSAGCPPPSENFPLRSLRGKFGSRRSASARPACRCSPAAFDLDVSSHQCNKVVLLESCFATQ